MRSIIISTKYEIQNCRFILTPLMRRRKTKFPTVYPTIYLPKWKFWIQLSPNWWFSWKTVWIRSQLIWIYTFFHWIPEFWKKTCVHSAFIRSSIVYNMVIFGLAKVFSVSQHNFNLTVTVKDDDDILPLLLEEFPHLHLSLHTWHELWRKGLHQIEQITRAHQEVRRKKTRAQSQVSKTLFHSYGKFCMLFCCMLIFFKIDFF